MEEMVRLEEVACVGEVGLIEVADLSEEVGL
jgi:hypothetical protein